MKKMVNSTIAMKAWTPLFEVLVLGDNQTHNMEPMVPDLDKEGAPFISAIAFNFRFPKDTRYTHRRSVIVRFYKTKRGFIRWTCASKYLEARAIYAVGS